MNILGKMTINTQDIVLRDRHTTRCNTGPHLSEFTLESTAALCYNDSRTPFHFRSVYMIRKKSHGIVQRYSSGPRGGTRNALGRSPVRGFESRPLRSQTQSACGFAACRLFLCLRLVSHRLALCVQEAGDTLLKVVTFFTDPAAFFLIGL